jgi:hypothetical protein
LIYIYIYIYVLPVSLDLTLGGHKEGRAVLLNNGLCGVDEGEPIGDGVLGEAVLLGEEPRRLVDNGSEIADILLGELSPDLREADGATSLLERCVDSFEGDAGAVRLLLLSPPAESGVCLEDTLL